MQPPVLLIEMTMSGGLVGETRTYTIAAGRIRAVSDHHLELRTDVDRPGSPMELSAVFADARAAMGFSQRDIISNGTVADGIATRITISRRDRGAWIPTGWTVEYQTSDTVPAAIKQLEARVMGIAHRQVGGPELYP